MNLADKMDKAHQDFIKQFNLETQPAKKGRTVKQIFDALDKRINTDGKRSRRNQNKKVER